MFYAFCRNDGKGFITAVGHSTGWRIGVDLYAYAEFEQH